MFVPEAAFELLVKKQIEKLEGKMQAMEEKMDQLLAKVGA